MSLRLGLEYSHVIYDTRNNIIGWIVKNGSFIDEPFKASQHIGAWFTYTTPTQKIEVNFL